MTEPPVVNASPLIVLARAQETVLLRLLGERVLVPSEVAAEVRAHSDEADSVLRSHSWIEEAPPCHAAEVVAAWNLGAGETGVLSREYAHPGTLAVLDDFAARKCANVLGIPVKGTLGLALYAKRRGHVDRARPLVEKLREAGLYLSDTILRDALRLVGE